MEWAEETVERLRALWDEGISTARIGLRLGVSKNAVVGKARRLDLSKRPSPIIRDGQPRATPTRTPRVQKDTLPLLSCLNGSTPAPEPRKPYFPRIVHSRASTERPTAATSALVAPTKYGQVIECCWPIGEPGTKSFRYCDDPSEPGKPYCPDHVKLAYVRIRDRREDAA